MTTEQSLGLALSALLGLVMGSAYGYREMGYAVSNAHIWQTRSSAALLAMFVSSSPRSGARHPTENRDESQDMSCDVN